MNNRNASPMRCLKQLRDLFQKAYRHITDEKKLPLTVVSVPLGQELLHQNANFPSRRLLVFEFIHHNGFKTGGTDLENSITRLPLVRESVARAAANNTPLY